LYAIHGCLQSRIAHNALEDKMTIKIVLNEKSTPGKLADVELHFTSGGLDPIPWTV
jgi:hypothetical protein